MRTKLFPDEWGGGRDSAGLISAESRTPPERGSGAMRTKLFPDGGRGEGFCGTYNQEEYYEQIQI